MNLCAYCDVNECPTVFPDGVGVYVTTCPHFTTKLKMPSSIGSLVDAALVWVTEVCDANCEECILGESGVCTQLEVILDQLVALDDAVMGSN